MTNNLNKKNATNSTLIFHISVARHACSVLNMGEEGSIHLGARGGAGAS